MHEARVQQMVVQNKGVGRWCTLERKVVDSVVFLMMSEVPMGNLERNL